MSRQPATVTPEVRASAALVRLLTHDVPALPVVMGLRVVGLISESDLTRVDTRDDGGATVADLMSTPAVTMPMHAVVTELAGVMLGRDLPLLPILDREGYLVGTVGRMELLSTLVHGEEPVTDRVRRQLYGFSGLRPRWNVEQSAGAVVVTGVFSDNMERRRVAALIRAVPGVRRVELRALRPDGAQSGA